jgi:hypothetical protein
LKLVGLGFTTMLVFSLDATRAAAASSRTDIGALTGSLFTSPASFLIFVIELFLGIGLGYVSVKALKYLLAFVALTLLGLLLNVWQAPQLASQLGSKDLIAISEEVVTFAYALGLTTVLPMTVGFIVGAIVGALK